MNIEINSDVITVTENIPEDWEKKIYLFSDVHFDSMYCQRDIYTKHLESAKKEDAWILDAGDLFDAMQGRFDPRRNMDDLRPEYRRADYYDYVVGDVASFLTPYADNFVMLGMGNHELGVLKNVNSNLTDRLASKLREQKSQVVCGGFKGWVRILVRRDNIPSGSVVIRFSHSGGGGNAPVTRGVIDTNRQAVYLPDANIVWNGHNHHGWIVPIARERISNKGVIYSDLAWYVRTPGYKAEYLNSSNGFEAQRAGGPRPLGCVVVSLTHFHRRLKIKVEPLFEV